MQHLPACRSDCATAVSEGRDGGLRRPVQARSCGRMTSAAVHIKTLDVRHMDEGKNDFVAWSHLKPCSCFSPLKHMSELVRQAIISLWLWLAINVISSGIPIMGHPCSGSIALDHSAANERALC